MFGGMFANYQMPLNINAQLPATMGTGGMGTPSVGATLPAQLPSLTPQDASMPQIQPQHGGMNPMMMMGLMGMLGHSTPYAALGGLAGLGLHALKVF